MKYITEFRNNELAQGLIADIHRKSKRKVRFMEFCGGHTVAIFKYGIRQALPGPLIWCPDWVVRFVLLLRLTSTKAIALALIPGVIISFFGDLLRVPGSRSSLQQHAPRARMSALFIQLLTLSKLLRKIQKERWFLSVLDLKQLRRRLLLLSCRQRNRELKITAFYLYINSVLL